MRHGRRPDCSLELIQASSVVARYRQNFPTFRAGTSPRLAIRSSTFGWIFSTWDASLLVRSTSIPCGISDERRSSFDNENDSDLIVH
jgi:hypothetical protein